MPESMFRIATWNIASNSNFSAIARRSAALQIDICAVQEMTIDPAASLVPMLRDGDTSSNAYNWHFAPALTPEQTGRGFYGLGFLSRVPLRRTASFQLGPTGIGPIKPETEPRLLQVVVPALPYPMVIGNTHLAPTDDWSLSSIRRQQAKTLTDILRPTATREMIVLCGDFNAGPSSSDLANLGTVLPHVHSSLEATFIGEPNRPPIDFFFSSRRVIADIAVHSSEGLSDHNIVVATFAGGLC